VTPTVVVSAFNVANFPGGGGHMWVYLQYALGLSRLGCNVYWMERFVRSKNERHDAAAIAKFFARMESFGLGGRAVLLADPLPGNGCGLETLGMSALQTEELIRDADLLLNFHYAIDPELLGRFRRTAMVDIDPGLFQFWLSRGQLAVPRHDVYLTTGETVGMPETLVPDVGLPWAHIPPSICLEEWDFTFDPKSDRMTTVSTWDSVNWVKDADGSVYENTKRAAFLDVKTLPRTTDQKLELALFLRTTADYRDRRLMERHGWRIRHTRDVAASPDAYRDYIRGSRAEFSPAKRSCMKFQNAWVSDRTLCYLASGKPVVVQDTGPSRLLPNGEGMFRFTTIEDAAQAIEAINADYERQCHAARALAERFDAKRVAARILEVAL
jgi:hypothetical protein